MKIKWGALVVDGRGKLGGHVASQNKGGSYLRTKVTPSNPQTVFQSTVRAIFGAISAGWSALTASQIAAWNSAVSDWAKTNIFGDIKQPSGKALYQRLNQNAQLANFGAITDPPAKVDVISSLVGGVEFAIGAGSMTPAVLTSGGGNAVTFSATEPVTAGTSFVKNKLRDFYTIDAASFSATDAFDAYEARFGAVALGQKIYVGIKYTMDTGQTSVREVVLSTVVA